MKIPKVEFRWSFIYEEKFHAPFVKGIIFNRESYRTYVERYIERVKQKWQPISSEVLGFMAKISNLKWKAKTIPCYIVKISTIGPISDPLTIPIQLKVGKKVFRLTTDRFIDILIHELIHNLFIQNETIDRYFDYLINKKYRKEGWNVAIHVPIHAIHQEIFLKFFDKKRLDREKKICENYPDYKRAWEIVEKEGSKEIIKELKNF